MQIRALGGLLSFMDQMPAARVGQHDAAAPIIIIRMFSMYVPCLSFLLINKRMSFLYSFFRDEDVAIDQNSLK